ncbi:hypothetical protein Cgig2_018404 [Carnegiea gigantea]|uniref:Uncharacterized protein n=1 Tax=Carnegiea gigantea TaxID=171969 RepID=A0A9Q1GP41_9CARY|nr:hypothetical protein Cgig2_018404 [Carnegiea gigantea]
MDLQPQTLNVAFFPFMAPGHMIPILDLARLFAAKGAKAIIITTPFNSTTLLKPLERSKSIGPPISIEIVPFPCEEVGLPKGVENPEAFSSLEMRPPRCYQPSLELVLEKLKPNCLVADFLLPCATQAAKKFNIPRLVFHIFGRFPIRCAITLCYPPPSSYYKIHKIATDVKDSNCINPRELLLRAFEIEEQSCGIIVNSFHELEPEYADHYKKLFGRRKKQCLKWLDSKKPNSVIYVCFGTMALFPDSQLRGITMGPEASEQEFIWVVRRDKDLGKGDDEWLLDGCFVWAPYGDLAGFYNEKLVTEVLKIGVAVGAKKWSRIMEVSVKWEDIRDAIEKVMMSEEGLEMRSRAKKLKEMARQAGGEGGLSYSDLSSLVQELGSCVRQCGLCSNLNSIDSLLLKLVDLGNLKLVFEKLKPNCVVVDLLHPFATQAAKKFNIPKVIFHTLGCFPICCAITLGKYQPHKSVETDDEEFVIPRLPHLIKSTPLQLSPDVKDCNPTNPRELLLCAFETEEQSYGIVVNSFYELEPECAGHYKFFGRRKESSLDEKQCLKWLDSKKPNSVIYICFGTMALFPDSQLREIAMGLEASGQDFIWVVRRDKDGGK